MDLSALITMSRKYGTEEYVLAGGGNTSVKDGNTLYVKGSGTSLAEIAPEQFVAMDMRKLAAMLEKEYPTDDDAREGEALADVLAARLPGEEAKRPSVEALLHGIFPQKYMLHVHPPLVNGLSCGKDGERICSETFGDGAVWIPLTKPGFTLAAVCKKAFDESRQKTGVFPNIAILKNHGICIAADTLDEIDRITSNIMDALEKRLIDKPDFSEVEFDAEAVCRIAPALRMLYSQDGRASAVFFTNRTAAKFASGLNEMAPIALPFSPDHIVYCKASPMFVEPDCDVAMEFGNFKKLNGYAPKIVAVKGLGFFALGKDVKEAHIARAVFTDAMKVAVYAGSFGGYLPLPRDFTDFILNWEAENYRQKVSQAGMAKGRLEAKICIVTGGAQGIGEGIVRSAMSEGAYAVVADLNGDGASRLAADLCAQHGAGRAVAVKADVTDEASVKNMVQKAVLCFGGLDVLVSNAGILIAGGLTEMTREKMDLVTSVNYTGYFLAVKYACEPMKIQRAHSREYTADIIEINSKSGLEGSNKNFAYAGSKFGGIGLTRSFALELVDFGIKVNAVCPGNFLDGPLWSDPVKGLFKQYLDAGKVPGAKSLEDVRAFYESKVPMGRGCTAKDVARAIFYCVEQSYETGQSITVTGGQIMK